MGPKNRILIIEAPILGFTAWGPKPQTLLGFAVQHLSCLGLKVQSLGLEA